MRRLQAFCFHSPPPDFVERPEATEMVQRTIISGTGRYKVIIGNPGYREKIAAAEFAGVIYVSIVAEDMDIYLPGSL